MIEEKRLKKAEERVKRYLKEGEITTGCGKEFVDFFLKNSDNSMNSAKALFMLSTDKEKQKAIGFTEFNGLLWVVNAGYYSMFYMARALLENAGIRIKADRSVHAISFDALIYFFYLTGKLQKHMIEDFAEATEETAELLGKQKAIGLMEDYFYEKRKRAAFTYEMGAIVMQAKAKTSIERASKFNLEIRKILYAKQ